MTVAVLSFATRKIPGRVMFHCNDLALSEARDLEPDPPFAGWTRAYEAGQWTSESLLGIGLAIGTWLDGPQQWLSRLVQATAPVTLVIETSRNPDSIEQAALDAPWELIARVTRQHESQLAPVDWQYVEHLAFEPSCLLSVVRRLGPSTPPLEPSKYRLSAVFMPCRPDASAGVSVDARELAIRTATDSIEMHLEIEDSGGLGGLGDLIAQLGEYDVLQLSCPATMAPSPALAFEGVQGERVDVSASDIWNQIGQVPRLLIVSAYGESAAPSATRGGTQHASAAVVGSGVLGPLSIQLCQRGWPAVIGFASTTAAQVEIDFVAALYRLLSRRQSLLDAFARACRLVEHTAATLWHTARLVLGPGGGGPLVDGTDVHPKRRLFIQNRQFLDPNGQIRISTDYQTSLHRRAFQSVVGMLRDTKFPGIVVHGSDDRTRDAFVSRVLQRLEGRLRRVVLTANLDVPAILRAIREQTAHSEVALLSSEYRDRLRDDPSQLQDALRAIIEGPCRNSRVGAFALVLHNFDPAPGSDRVVILRALLGAFAGADTASRLLITCNARFSAIDDEGHDISQLLAWQALDVGHRSSPVETRSAPPALATPGTSSTMHARPIGQTTADQALLRRSRTRRRVVAGGGVALACLGVVLAFSRTRADEPRWTDQTDAGVMPFPLRNMQKLGEGIEEALRAAESIGHPDERELKSNRTSLSSYYGYGMIGGGGIIEDCESCKNHPAFPGLRSSYDRLDKRQRALEEKYLECTFGYKMSNGDILRPTSAWSRDEWAKILESSTHKTARCWMTQDPEDYR
jgi:hypothetical protein